MKETRLNNILEFIKKSRIENCSKELQEHVKKCFLDTTMVLCAGTRNESSKKIAKFSENIFPGNEATILSSGKKTSLIGATIANAMAANALDLDDGFSLTKGHPGAGLIGGLLSASETTECTYGDFLSSLLVGYELCIRQGLCIQDYYNFYHSTGSYAGFGTAACVGKLLDVSDDVLANALGIADYYGPLVPCMRSVRVPSLNKDGIYLGAQIGVESILLAQAGIDGKSLIMTDDKYKNYISSLGEKYYIFDLYFKFYSCCRWAQGALAAVANLNNINKINVNEIKKIDVYSYGASGELYSGIPQNETEAQYNLKYPLASFLINGKFGPYESSLNINRSNEIISLMNKINFNLDSEFEKLFPAKRYTRVKIELLDGSIIDTGAIEPKGEANSSVSIYDIVEKSIEINSIFNDEAEVKDVIDVILNSDYSTDFKKIREKIIKIACEDNHYDRN